jgi:hypothetical protein
MVHSPLKRRAAERVLRATFLSAVLAAVSAAAVEDTRADTLTAERDAGASVAKENNFWIRPSALSSRAPLANGTGIPVTLVADLAGATAEPGVTPASGSTSEPAPGVSRKPPPKASAAPHTCHCRAAHDAAAQPTNHLDSD